MTRKSKYREGINNKKFAKAVILEGKTQAQAYQEIHPEAKWDTCRGNASQYAKRPGVIANIEKYVAQINEEDVKGVVKSIVRDAKGAKKDVVYNSKGDKTTVKDTQMTLGSREQFFKLAGHPGFTKVTNLNIDNRSMKVDDELANELLMAIRNIGSKEIEECNQDGVERGAEDADYS